MGVEVKCESIQKQAWIFDWRPPYGLCAGPRGQHKTDLGVSWMPLEGVELVNMQLFANKS